MTPVSTRIVRVDPLELDLDLADALAEVFTACDRADGLPFQPKTGPDLLTSRQRGTDSRPVDAMFVAFDGDRPVAAMSLQDGRTVADPFMRTANVVDLLRMRARQERSGPARRLGLGRLGLAA